MILFFASQMLGELVHDQHPKLTNHRDVSQNTRRVPGRSENLKLRATCSETTRLACSAKQATSHSGSVRCLPITH